jgi:acyl-CoA reductase-like NAD-dependent aldehyde dehydrogenase
MSGVMDAPELHRLECPDVAARCDAARSTQPWWADVPIASRARVITEAARRLAADAPALASLIAVASGRPLAEVWASELVPTLDALAWLARRGPACLAPRRLRRSRLQWYLRGRRPRLSWEPHGVVGVVTPANALLYLSVPQIAAALLAGNAVVWKPAPSGTGLALHATALFRHAGVPAGALQVVPGGAVAARAVIEAGVAKLFFTGSSAAGLELYRMQAARGRPAVLELSGHHVAVVLSDADLALAAAGIAWSKLANAGRNCVSVQLALVQRAVLPAFVDRVTAALATAPGPASAATFEGRRTALVADAVARGAHAVRAGLDGPTLLVGVAPGMRVVDEEVQGPILGIAPVDSEDEAVAWINGGARRLSASVWTRDRRHARRLARRLDTGHVFINEELHPVGQPDVTLAGRGASGFGASRGEAGLLEMVQPKVVSELPLGAARRHYAGASDYAIDLFDATTRLAFSRRLDRRMAAAGGLVRAVTALVRGR